MPEPGTHLKRMQAGKILTDNTLVIILLWGCVAMSNKYIAEVFAAGECNGKSRMGLVRFYVRREADSRSLACAAKALMFLIAGNQTS